MEVPTTRPFPEPLPAERAGRDWVVATDGVEVKLTNLDKVYWGPEGLTKADLLTYYWNAAPAVLPYLAGRPLTMKRMPEGADGPFFYAKQAPPGTPAWLRRAPVVSIEDSKRVDYLLADDRAGLLWLANAGCIELHPWHSRVDQIGRPDYAFFDLDPMGAATFADAAEVALLVRTVLDGLGLRGYPRTSGATGMQVYVPIDRVHPASDVRAWVGAVFTLLNRAAPERTTMTWEIGRRGDAIFLDHNMNTEGKNIAATWCLRPERAAPAATPLSWEEVERGLAPTDFTISTVWPRLDGEPGREFAAVLRGGQDLTAAMAALGVAPARGADAAPRHRVEPAPASPAAAVRAAPASPDAPADPAPAAESAPGALSAYDAKRDFRVTPEPAGGAPAAPAPASAHGAPRFVVQHHLATRLHHDLRLEHEGTAPSWALPKGLPEVPGLRHLAVQTEDHPLAYLDFSGTIPRGEYGGGEMRIWDRGTYETVEWKDGKVTVRLSGARHTGEYHLFRIGRDDPSQWMVTRAAPPAPAPPAPPPLEPMLASPWPDPFDDDAWSFEVKWDGVRAVATVTRPGFGEEGSTRLVSRLGNDITGGYPELADLWERVLAFNAVLDGELVALTADGRPDFQLLQHRMHVRGEQAARAARRSPITYVVFDVLAVDGVALLDRPLEERQRVLADLVVPGARVVPSEPVPGRGRDLFAAVTGRGLEGVVAKRRTSRYHPGRRSPDWRKIKARSRALAVVGGWLPGEGARGGTVGALLVGFLEPRPEGGAPTLEYAGRVGSGFDDAELARVLALLEGREADAPPFGDLTRLPPEAQPRRRRARWVRPDLVCLVEYTERTEVSRLRAPVYKGMRPDATPRDATGVPLLPREG